MAVLGFSFVLGFFTAFGTGFEKEEAFARTCSGGVERRDLDAGWFRG